MNKYKILIGINIILLLALIVCIFSLIRKTSEKDPVKEKFIETEDYSNCFWFRDIGAHVFSKKDTIQLGEEYTAKIFQVGAVMRNEKQKLIVVLDGDTLNVEEGYCIFKEKPQKKGLVKHKGYMTAFHSQGMMEIELEFEYYVK